MSMSADAKETQEKQPVSNVALEGKSQEEKVTADNKEQVPRDDDEEEEYNEEEDEDFVRANASLTLGRRGRRYR